MFGIIYKIKNIITDKEYIGQTTKTLNKRIKEHEYNTIKGGKCYIHNSMRKYGFNEFKFSILCECDSRNDLDEKEIFFIKEYNTLFPHGYNLTNGGKGSSGYHPSKETRLKIGKGNKGKTVPLKIRKQISISSKGKIRTKEHCKNISKGLTGKKQSEEHRKNNSKGQMGKKLTQSTKQKIRNTLRKYSDETISSIIELRENNLTWNKISILLNIPEGTVNGLVKRYNKEKSI